MFVRSQLNQPWSRPLRKWFRPAVEVLEGRILPSGALPQATIAVSFSVGRMVADPVRDLVYVGDQTNDRILAVDTDQGRTINSAALANAPGALAVSVYGTQLFVAEPDGLAIQVLSLPGLNVVNTLNVGIPVGNLVAAANNHLFVSTPGGDTFNDIDEIDGQTGAVLATVSSGNYYNPLLRTNATGTELYIRETGASSVDTNIDEFDVGGTGPYERTHGYLAPLANSEDFIVNEAAQRIYTADGGVYGVGVTHMATDTESVWSFGGAPYGVAVAALPSGPVYGAAELNGIYQFDSAGNLQAQYALADTNAFVLPESLKITPNGHLLYASSLGDALNDRLTILGVSRLVVEDVPVARFSFTPGAGRQVSFDASASQPGSTNETLTQYAWRYGDGTTGTGQTVTHTYRAAGPYTVQLSVVSSGGQSDTVSAKVLGGSIAGTVFDDANGDGLIDNADPGLAGWPVYLDLQDLGHFVPGDPVTLTAADGSYAFAGLNPATTYVVRIVPFAGFVATTPMVRHVVPATGPNAPQHDFGEAKPATISGNVFHDFDGNAADHLPLKGWTVYLNATRAGTLVPGAVTMHTGADGSYAFAGLKPATYVIRVVVPRGWLAATATSMNVTAAEGMNATSNNFNVALPATISGTVFNDANADGRQENGESGLSGWTVLVQATGASAENPLRMVTDAHGRFAFGGLAPGEYTVQLVVKTGWKSLLPLNGILTIAVTSGEFADGLGFAVTRTSMG